MRHNLISSAALALLCLPLLGQPAGANSAEERTARRLEGLRKDPPALRAFLAQMPKGADLHMHLSGAVYAETFVREAVEDGLCIDTALLALVKPKAGETSAAECPEGTVAASSALRDQSLYDSMINSLSMRSFVPSAGFSGHDQFFATFGRAGGIRKQHQGEWLDEVAARAAAQNEQYLEIMTTPDFSSAVKLAQSQGWKGIAPEDLAAARDALLAGGIKVDLASDENELDSMERLRNERERCGTLQAAPGCKVTVRYLFQVLRANPPEQVFAQTLLGFELASIDPRVVGINFVQPEDARLSMEQYSAQMQMVAYLRKQYPKVHVSLHAGELAMGLVPPEGLASHIHEAVEVAGAERIGHGVDVMLERDPAALLHEMATRHILVEINLTSNDVILGVRGRDHPLHSYLAAGVPFNLNTDDEGVSRIDLTNEYTRAVLDQGLTYAQLKQSARAGLEHSFLPGESLWASADNFTRMRNECLQRTTTTACSTFLKGSEKAQQQMELEKRFAAFEREKAR